MIEYLPWSTKQLKRVWDLYEEGRFAILDIELGSQCNLSCVYCDSPNRNLSSKVKSSDVENVFRSDDIEWLFVCGIGEPLHSGNRQLLFELLRLCERYNVKCSMFTNCVNIDTEIYRYLKNGVLHLLIKLDSLDPAKIERIYKTSSANRIMSNIRRIEEHIRTEDDCSNIAVSIVPTSMNEEEVVELVQYALDKKMFPLVGYLEYAGSAIPRYNELAIPKANAWRIKAEIAKITNGEYSIPVCPSVVGGIHINHDNRVVVDKLTGLSCSWFWLKTPETIEICDFDSNMTLKEIAVQIIGYRHEKLQSVSQKLKTLDNSPFGGCGGDIKVLLGKYLDLHTKSQSADS